MLHLPLTTHFLFFMNFPIFSIKKIIFFFPKNVKLGRLEGMIFLSMCAKYLVQSPSISSKNALVCAMACPWQAMACPVMPWCVPRSGHGVPRQAFVCAMATPWVAKACNGLPWCVPWPAMGCHDMPWCVPWQAMGCPWHALVCATTSHARVKLIFARATLANCASKFIT